MRRFAVPLCVAVAALAGGCTTTSSGKGVEARAPSKSPTATGIVPSLPSGSSGPGGSSRPTDLPSGLPTDIPTPSKTHSLGPEQPSSSPSRRSSPSKAPRPSPSKSPKPTGPAAVVTSYIAAINRHDYRTAWTIYRHAAHGQSYADFVAGFRSTDHDELRVLGTSGSTVQVDLVAYQTDGSKRHYTGTYTVRNGRIYASHISAAS